MSWLPRFPNGRWDNLLLLLLLLLFEIKQEWKSISTCLDAVWLRPFQLRLRLLRSSGHSKYSASSLSLTIYLFIYLCLSAWFCIFRCLLCQQDAEKSPSQLTSGHFTTYHSQSQSQSWRADIGQRRGTEDLLLASLSITWEGQTHELGETLLFWGNRGEY